MRGGLGEEAGRGATALCEQAPGLDGSVRACLGSGCALCMCAYAPLLLFVFASPLQSRPLADGGWIKRSQCGSVLRFVLPH